MAVHKEFISRQCCKSRSRRLGLRVSPCLPYNTCSLCRPAVEGKTDAGAVPLSPQDLGPLRGALGVFSKLVLVMELLNMKVSVSVKWEAGKKSKFV